MKEHVNKRITELAKQKKQASSLEQKQSIAAEIVALLREQYADKLHYYERYSLSDDEYATSLEKLDTLEDDGYLTRLHMLRPERKREEITDTTMLGYLQIALVRDPSDYRKRHREKMNTLSGDDFVTKQAEVIDALPLDISLLSDRELIALFSATTQHVYTQDIPLVRYRHEAVQHVDALKHTLGKAKPIQLGLDSESYKIVQLPNEKIIDFRYTNFFNTADHEDRAVRIQIWDSWQSCQQDYAENEQKMRTTAILLDDLSNRYAQRYLEDTPITEHTITSITQDIIALYKGKHPQIARDRLQRSIVHRQHMYTNQYSIMFRAILDDIQKAVYQLHAMADRFGTYTAGKFH